MRVGASILYKDGFCFQSYGWNMLRPLGDLQHAINMLEAYQIDEISIIRPVRGNDEPKGLAADIQKLENLKTMTPISFGGGISSLTALKLLKNVPIERLVLSSAYIDKNDPLIKAATELYGRQALQALLPLCYVNNTLSVFNCQKKTSTPLSTDELDYCVNNANEIILYDIKNEGMNDGFDYSIVDAILVQTKPINNSQLILAGGIGEKTAKYARDKQFAAVLVENRVLHHEYSLGRYKHG